MDTPPPSAGPVHSLRSRKIVVVALGVPVVVAFTALLLQYRGLINVEGFGLPENYLYIGAFAVILLGIIPVFVVWRCPACRAYLGREINPARCPACGANFR